MPVSEEAAIPDIWWATALKRVYHDEDVPVINQRMDQGMEKAGD
jgi:hypothetical protein